MRVLLIRHGETDRNVDGRALSRDDVPLNDRGREQARAIADALAERAVYGAIDAIYSSPLQRAVATATPFAEALGLEIERDERLIEMAAGELEGVSRDVVRERYPDFLRGWLSEDEVADVRMPGGETLREVQERSWPLLVELAGRHPDATVAVVSHNFVLRALLCRALDLPLGRFRRLLHDLAAIAAVDLGGEHPHVLVMNDRAHLRLSGAGPFVLDRTKWR